LRYYHGRHQALDRPEEGAPELAARNRGESFGPRQYAFAEVLELDTLPCWRHLLPTQYRTRMAGLVDQVITAAPGGFQIDAGWTKPRASPSGRYGD
jgi:hypothetical protein